MLDVNGVVATSVPAATTEGVMMTWFRKCKENRYVAEACDVIGSMLASLTNFVNFDMIVVGGGMVEQLKDFMLPKIEIAFNDHVLNAAAKDLNIVTSELGGNAAIWGGISLAEEFLDIKV